MGCVSEVEGSGAASFAAHPTAPILSRLAWLCKCFCKEFGPGPSRIFLDSCTIAGVVAELGVVTAGLSEARIGVAGGRLLVIP